MKQCKVCKQTLPETEFYSAGNGYLRGDCKVCQKKTVRKRQSAIREEYISWKKTLKCNRCGFDDYRALQFHHNSDKEGNVAQMMTSGYSLDAIKKEAAKCEVLCANCHQIHHCQISSVG